MCPQFGEARPGSEKNKLDVDDALCLRYHEPNAAAAAAAAASSKDEEEGGIERWCNGGGVLAFRRAEDAEGLLEDVLRQKKEVG